MNNLPINDRDRPGASQQKKRKVAAGDTPPDAAPARDGSAAAPPQGSSAGDPPSRSAPGGTAGEITAAAGPRPAEARGDGGAGETTQGDRSLDQLIADAVSAAVQREFRQMRSALQADFSALKDSLQENIEDIGRRVSEIETYLNERDNRIKVLEMEVQQRDTVIKSLIDQMEEMDTERRRNTLIFTGSGVPAVTDGSRPYDEDVPATVLSMVRDTFPSVRMERSDIASCYRVGAKRTLVVQFVRYGRGTARDQLYQARFELMKNRDKSKTIYVNESLSAARRRQLNVLRAAKQYGRIHSVFTRDCAVYYRERRDGVIRRVDRDEQLRAFEEAGNT